MTGRPAASSRSACALALSRSPGPYRAVSWAPALTVGLTTTSGQSGQSAGVAGREPGGRHHRHAGRGQLAQVGLVGVPGDHVGRVGQPRHARRPGREVVPARRVVPGRPDHHQVVRAPVDGRVVPDPPLGVQPGRRAGGQQRAGVLVPGRQLPAGGQRDPRHPPGRARRSARARARSAHQRVDGHPDEQDRQVGVGEVEQRQRPGRRAPLDPGQQAVARRPGTSRRRPARPPRRPTRWPAARAAARCATVSQV